MASLCSPGLLVPGLPGKVPVLRYNTYLHCCTTQLVVPVAHKPHARFTPGRPATPTHPGSGTVSLGGLFPQISIPALAAPLGRDACARSLTHFFLSPSHILNPYLSSLLPTAFCFLLCLSPSPSFDVISQPRAARFLGTNFLSVLALPTSRGLAHILDLQTEIRPSCRHRSPSRQLQPVPSSLA